MKSLVIPKSDFNYPISHFTQLRRFRQINNDNYHDLLYRCNNINYNIVNQHVLVQLLKKLSISKDWSLEYVIQLAKAERNGLASFYDFSCINNRGKRQTDVYYGNNYYEHICLIDLNRSYEDYQNAKREDLTPIIPLYSTNTEFGYMGMYEKKFNNNKDTLLQFGVLGVDIIELAVGYWQYLNVGSDNTNDEMGSLTYDSHTYLAKSPLINCQMIQNQLTVVNVLYNNRILGKTLEDFTILAGNFNHTSSSDIVSDFIKYVDLQCSSRKLINGENFLNYLYPLYNFSMRDKQGYLNIDSELYQCFDQCQWVYQLSIIKIFTLVLKYNNITFTKCGYINSVVEQWLRNYKDMFQHIKDSNFKAHVNGLVDELKTVYDINKK